MHQSSAIPDCPVVHWSWPSYCSTICPMYEQFVLSHGKQNRVGEKRIISHGLKKHHYSILVFGILVDFLSFPQAPPGMCILVGGRLTSSDFPQALHYFL